MTITPEAGAALSQAVTELTDVVRGLRELMEKDYPKRDELEETFVTKYGIRKRRRQLAAVLVTAIIGSYFVTMGTVSYCFLQGQGSVTESKQLCYLLPGYGDVVDYSKKRLKIFNDKFSQIEQHEARLDQLEKK